MEKKAVVEEIQEEEAKEAQGENEEEMKNEEPKEVTENEEPKEDEPASGPSNNEDDPIDVSLATRIEEISKELQRVGLCQLKDTDIQNLYGDYVLQVIQASSLSGGEYHLSFDGKVTAIVLSSEFQANLLCDDDDDWNRYLGKIRNQHDHHDCWGYVATDMVSAGSIKSGWETDFYPLSTLHLCLYCAPHLLGTYKQAREEGHSCYPYSVKDCLEYIRDHGVPREVNPVYCCNLRPTAPLVPSPHIGSRIESILTFEKLEDALVHLPNHLVAADVVLYPDLFENFDEVYHGPKTKFPECQGYHSVIIEKVLRYSGDVVARCRMSNGIRAGVGGRVYISLTTKFVVVGLTAGNKNLVRDTGLPQHLLCNFVVVKMHKKKRESSQSELRRGKRRRSTSEEAEKTPSPRAKLARTAATMPHEAEPEYFKDKRDLEDLWKAAFPVGTEWDQQDELYEFNWDFKNLEEALEEGGMLYGKKIYVFGCTESHLVPHNEENKNVLVPAVVCIESSIPPSDKIGVASVQGGDEEIIPMKNMKMAWVPYIPLDKRDRAVERTNFPIFVLGCTQRRSALKHLKEERAKKFNYCLPYINNPFKEDESSVVQITFPSEPPIECEYDWATDTPLEELTNDLIKKKSLLMDQKDEFKEFVKDKVSESMAANEEAQAKATEGMSEETKKAYKEMKLYKFYPLPSSDTPDVAGITKSSVINKYFGNAHEVF